MVTLQQCECTNVPDAYTLGGEDGKSYGTSISPEFLKFERKYIFFFFEIQQNKYSF